MVQHRWLGDGVDERTEWCSGMNGGMVKVREWNEDGDLERRHFVFDVVPKVGQRQTDACE